MSIINRWNSQEGWAEWINEDSNERNPRIIGNSIKLPFQRISHVGFGTLPGELLARWSFGYRGNIWNTLNVDTVNDDDTLNPGVGINITNALSVPTAVSSFVEMSEFGFNSKTRVGHAVVNEVSDFDFSLQNIYASCWIKSNTIDYSSNVGFIFGYYETLATPRWYVAVDTNNTIKLFVYSGGILVSISPVGGDVIIDSNWHNIFVAMGVDGALTRAQILVVDNNWGDGPISGVNNIAHDAVGASDFSIGSSERAGEINSGFSGIIDEVVCSTWTPPDPQLKNLIDASSGSLTASDFFGSYLLSHRFKSHVFLSPVFDTGQDNSLLLGIYTEYESPNGSSVEFSFRASNTTFTQSNTSVKWTGFTSANQLPSGVVSELKDIGVYVKGRYQQVRVRLSPSNEYSSIPDSLQLETPVLYVVEISTGNSNKLLPVSNTAFEPGTILGQIVRIPGTHTIDKLSLNLSVTATDAKEFIVGKGGVLSFQAANFWDGRETWVFQPILHWLPSNDWITSGTTIQNTLQNQNYYSVEDSIANAPFLKYRLFFPSSGNYDLWGYGYTSSGVYWSIGDDITHLRKFTLGDDSSGWSQTPKWTKFGNIFINEGGVYNFNVYLSDNSTIILDQWYFTDNKNFINEVELDTPMPLSEAPFNTAVRLRSLYGGDLDDLGNPQANSPVSFSTWLSSRVIKASGKFSYEIRDTHGNGLNFTDGLSIEYWQIGGSENNFAAWDFSEVTQ